MFRWSIQRCGATSNLLIEHFYQLTAALMSHCNSDLWIELLPLVLLDIRKALNENLQCAATELFICSTLWLPGSNQYVSHLKSTIQELHVLPVGSTQSSMVYIGLYTCRPHPVRSPFTIKYHKINNVEIWLNTHSVEFKASKYWCTCL